MHSESQTSGTCITMISYKPLNLLGTQDTMAVTCPVPLWGL